MATDQKCRIVNRDPNWKGKWFFQRENEQRLQVYTDDPAQAALLSPEWAVSIRDRFRSLGNDVCIEDTQGNVLFERETVDEPRYDSSRSPRFVPFTNGLGLIATPGNTPSGPCWFVRAVDVPAFAADSRHTAIESVFGNTPEEAAQRAADTWGQQILFSDLEVVARAEQAERQKQFIPGLRPGDRR